MPSKRGEKPQRDVRKLLELKGFPPDNWRGDAILLLRDISSRFDLTRTKTLSLLDLILDESTTADEAFPRLVAETVVAA